MDADGAVEWLTTLQGKVAGVTTSRDGRILVVTAGGGEPGTNLLGSISALGRDGALSWALPIVASSRERELQPHAAVAATEDGWWVLLSFFGTIEVDEFEAASAPCSRDAPRAGTAPETLRPPRRAHEQFPAMNVAILKISRGGAVERMNVVRSPSVVRALLGTALPGGAVGWAGRFNGSLELGSASLQCADAMEGGCLGKVAPRGGDVVVAVHDAGGAPLWAHALGRDGLEKPTAVATDNAAVLVAWTSSDGTSQLDRFDRSGRGWSQTLGHPAHSIVQVGAEQVVLGTEDAESPTLNFVHR